jgi:genome maintenance exonuclease 1
VGIEYPLYSHTLRTAGRTDLVAVVKGELVIIDFKTAKRKKQEDWVHNYFLQAACYGMMFNALINTRIKQFYVLIATDEDGLQIFNKNMIDYEKEVTHIFTTRG